MSFVRKSNKVNGAKAIDGMSKRMPDDMAYDDYMRQVIDLAKDK